MREVSFVDFQYVRSRSWGEKKVKSGRAPKLQILVGLAREAGKLEPYLVNAESVSSGESVDKGRKVFRSTP